PAAAAAAAAPPPPNSIAAASDSAHSTPSTSRAPQDSVTVKQELIEESNQNPVDHFPQHHPHGFGYPATPGTGQEATTGPGSEQQQEETTTMGPIGPVMPVFPAEDDRMMRRERSRERTPPTRTWNRFDASNREDRRRSRSRSPRNSRSGSPPSKQRRRHGHRQRSPRRRRSYSRSPLRDHERSARSESGEPREREYLGDPCAFCNSPLHNAIFCDEYTTYEERVQQSKFRDLCSTCLERRDPRYCNTQEHRMRSCSNCGKHNSHQAFCKFIINKLKRRPNGQDRRRNY
ncbi:hypothetical protein PFISCL1PPCAC_10930, partial [Pristionchus fissidentatus]